MTSPANDLVIERYEHTPLRCEDHDPRTGEVAALVAAVLMDRLPGLRVEHVGSTAVPGCAGKGIVDLAVCYLPGQLGATRELVDALGFQRQTTRDPFPEERPMRVGAITLGNRTYRLHVHVVLATSDEAADLLAFRDRLRADPALRAAYVIQKQELLAAGVTDSVDFSEAKGAFVQRVLRQLHLT